MFDGLDLSKVTVTHPDNMNWDYVKRLRDTVTVKLLLKGIVTRETAIAVAITRSQFPSKNRPNARPRGKAGVQRPWRLGGTGSRAGDSTGGTGW